MPLSSKFLEQLKPQEFDSHSKGNSTSGMKLGQHVRDILTVIRWDEQIGGTKQSRTCTRIVWDQAWNVTKSNFFRSETLKPGTHPFPFKFALCNGLPETVHILDGNHVSYELHADIRLANRRTVAITRPIYLFRMPTPINLEMMIPQVSVSLSCDLNIVVKCSQGI